MKWTKDDKAYFILLSLFAIFGLLFYLGVMYLVR